MKLRKIISAISAVVVSATTLPLTAYFMGSESVSAISAGDMNGDGLLTAVDVRLLQNFIAGKAVPDGAGDVNGDGRINVLDLALLKRLIGENDALSSVRINEVCASNKTSFIAADGTSPDWIELYNSGSEDVNLSGAGLSDGNKNRFKFVFPADTIIGSGEYLLVLCDDKTSYEPEYHAPFKISSAGETVYLTAQNGITIDSVDVPEADTDVTYGCYPDGSGNYALLAPTPGASNDTSDIIYRVDEPVFSAEGGFYAAGFDLSLSDTNGNTIYYTLDGSDPRTSTTAEMYSGAIQIYDNTSDPNVLAKVEDISLHPYEAPDYNIDKGIVVRAVCKDAKGNYSEVTTNNYFVNKTKAYYNDMKVIAISTDSDNLFNNQTGIYMVGDKYYEWKNSSSFDENMDLSSSENPTNYNSEGREWERPCNIQVFEQGELKYTSDAGMRIAGNWSTVHPQKSLTLYARSEYGGSKFRYDFFEGKATDMNGAKISEYEKVTLRNGGSNYANVRFLDDVNQWCCTELDMGTQAKYDYILFIDGEFWGYYSMQEKLDENYIESHYKIDKDDVTYIKNGMEYEGLSSTYSEYKSFWSWAMSADMSIDRNYQRVCDTFDMQSFMDYVAAQVYMYNWDCLINNNNWMIWRSDVTDPSNPYADGKWRFLLYDTDFTAGSNQGLTGARLNYFDNMESTGYINDISSLFWVLFENETFKADFYDTFLRVAGETFEANKVVGKLDEIQATLTPAIEDTYKRFGTDVNLKSCTNVVRDFYTIREGYAIHHLNQLYGIDDDWIDDGELINQFSWGIWMNDGLGSISYEDDGSVKVYVERPGQYAQASTAAVAMENGKRYSITYTVSCDKNVSCTVGFQEADDDYTGFYWTTRSIGPIPRSYTETFTMEGSDNVKFLINVDSYATDVTYIISDFSMVCLD